MKRSLGPAEVVILFGIAAYAVANFVIWLAEWLS